jgi:hypothetical protein
MVMLLSEHGHVPSTLAGEHHVDGSVRAEHGNSFLSRMVSGFVSVNTAEGARIPFHVGNAPFVS